MLKHQVDRRWKDGLHTQTRAHACVCATSAVNRRAFPKTRSQFRSLESLSLQSCKDRLSEVHTAFLGRR